MAAVLGIPCQLESAEGRRAFRAVLTQIRQRDRGDFERLQRVVLDVLPLTEAEAADGTQGEWKALHPDRNNRATWGYGLDETPGTMFVFEDMPAWRLKAVIAHELGHACTVDEDRFLTNAPSDEWRSEAAADCYAYKWGFGRLISRDRRTSQWSHHGARPGQTISERQDGIWVTWQLTRQFRYRLVKPAKVKRKVPKG